MARIRTIKPEFPHSESIGRVSRDARLLYVQLWTICDDSGRTRGNSRILASLLYPYDEDAGRLIDGWLSELENQSCIARYLVDGSTYLQVLNWLDHQRIDKPTPSKLPEFNEDSRLSSESSRKLATPPRGLLVGLEGIGVEGEGKGVERSRELANGSTVVDQTSKQEPDRQPNRPRAREAFDPGSIPDLNLEAWSRFLDYRSQIRKPYKPVSLPSAARKLAEFGSDQAAVVEQSIANGWEGLFDLKPGGGGARTGVRGRAKTVAELEAEEAARAGQ